MNATRVIENTEVNQVSSGRFCVRSGSNLIDFFLGDRAMKPCNTCNKILPLSAYDKDKRLLDGHRGDCKDCMKIYRNQPKRKQNEREWQRRNIKKYANVRRRYRRSHRAEDSLYSLQYQARSPERAAVRRVVRKALAAGELEKSTTCQECGIGGKIHGHHEDYNKPLEIIWLCPRCHKKRHLKQAGD